ncbi:MAG TPA: hypothetical protein V6D34_08005 [Candidatus Sericytochromatia bacterium]
MLRFLRCPYRRCPSTSPIPDSRFPIPAFYLLPPNDRVERLLEGYAGYQRFELICSNTLVRLLLVLTSVPTVT